MIDQEKRIAAATQAIFAAENGIDGDSIGTMIHENFRIEPTGDDKGLPATMDVCRRAAIAALAAADAAIAETHRLAPNVAESPDWRKILIAYINNVTECEGVDCLPMAGLSPLENAALTEAAAEGQRIAASVESQDRKAS